MNKTYTTPSISGLLLMYDFRVDVHTLTEWGTSEDILNGFNRDRDGLCVQGKQQDCFVETYLDTIVADGGLVLFFSKDGKGIVVNTRRLKSGKVSKRDVHPLSSLAKWPSDRDIVVVVPTPANP